MKKKFLALSLAAAMACSLMTGCGLNLDMLTGGPSSPVDVVKKYNELMQESVNYHTDMEMDFSIGANAQGMSIEMPIRMELSADVLDENMHGEMEMYMEFLGEAMEETMEIYAESSRKGITTYSYSKEDGYWTVSEDENGADLALGFTELDADNFENAVMEHNKTKGTYTLTQSFAEFADMGTAYNNLTDVYGGMAEMMSMDSDDFLEEWKDAEVVYVFDDEYYLISVEIEGCEYTGKVEQDGVKVDVSVKLSLSFEFSDYGKIKESDVEVPKDVVDSAVPSLSINLDDADVNVDISFGGNDSDDDYGYDGEDEPDEEPGEIHHPIEEVPDDQVIDEDPLSPVSGDKLGSYNGVPLTGMGDSWADTFGADGWVFDSEDGEYSFMTADNPKYNGAELYVYNSGRENTTRADIENDGVYGYNIDCMWSSTYPAMTWNGITFGASMDDIVSAYGQPDYTYESSMYTSYEYEVTDDIEITFYVGSTGLSRVMVSYYGGL